jgi:hypothetical protein
MTFDLNGAGSRQRPLRPSMGAAISVIVACGMTGQCAPSPGQWEVHDSKDPITDEWKFEAFLSANADSNGRHGTFEVTGTCDTSTLTFRIVYLSAFDKNLGYKLTNVIPTPKVVARVAIDGRVTNAVAGAPEHPNLAVFLFAPKPAEEGEKKVRTVLNGFAGISITDISPRELYAAKLMKVEMPLANGDLPILEIHPQDTAFQRFASRCKAAEDNLLRKEKEKMAAAAASEIKNQQAAEAQFLQSYGFDVQTYQRAAYGPPSVTDSVSNLDVKAHLAKDQKLSDYLKSLGPWGLEVGSRGVSDLPGSMCSHVVVPGDILPGLLDWNASQTQTVYVRCPKELYEKGNKIGQVAIETKGLDELRRRRAALLALGVSEHPAPAEPDAPPRSLPPSWTTKSWFVCPVQRLHKDKPTGTSLNDLTFLVRVPTRVFVVSREDGGSGGAMHVRVGTESSDTYLVSGRDLHESCPGR